MRFRLALAGPDGQTGEADYDTATSALIIDGQPIAQEIVPVAAVHSGRKAGPFRRLKIQMGLACNMGCAYCLQTPHRDGTAAPKDVAAFIAGLDGWWEAVADQDLAIEFWGGEPFIHWRTLRALVAEFRRRHPACRLSLITNGTLLDDAKVEWIIANDIAVAISHDGAGQHLRGRDPLTEAIPLAAIRRLLTERPDKTAFNAVLTVGNYSFSAIRAHIETAVGVTGVNLGTEGLIQVEGDDSARMSPATESDHHRIRLSLIAEILSGAALSVSTIAHRVSDFLHSIRTGRSLAALDYKCGMDRQDTLAVDLAGNILLCHNAPDKPLGHVTDLAAARLTAPHFLVREDCRRCPVVQLCRGGCMLLDGEDRARSCRNHFTVSSAILAGTIALITGMVVTDIIPLEP